MKKLRNVLLLAVILAPATAGAQVLHINKDPEPETQRCQNFTAAFHADGDVVQVDYHGQWRNYSDGRYSQNGGPNYGPCATERIVRVDASQEVVWEIEPSDLGLSRADKVSDLVARDDGRTLMTVRDGSLGDHTHSTVLLLDGDGDLLWKSRTKKAPKFSMARAYVGDGGELFVEYQFTNYGYKGGQFQLPGGKVRKLGVNQFKLLVTRLDPDSGKLVWEREGAYIMTAKGGDLLTYSVQRRGQKPVKTRYRLDRLSYAGKRMSKAYTSWMTSESMTSYARRGDELWMTTRVNKPDPSTGWVAERTGKLRVLNLVGEQLHSRTLSDGAQLAAPRDGAPMRIISPSNCTRGASHGAACVADSLDVLTLSSWKQDGVATSIRVRSHRFEHDSFEAASTDNGLWVSALTYYEHARGENGVAGAVTALYSPDSKRASRDEVEHFVWKPVPKPAEDNSPKSIRLSF